MTLDAAVALLVLLTAILHATWNAIVKQSADRLLSAALVMGTGSLMALALLPVVGLPPPSIRPYLAVSLGLHTTYVLFLVRAYQHGDLSQVYPIARGLAPLLVAWLSASLMGERLSPLQVCGLLVVSAGVASLALSGAARRDHSWTAVLLALATGVLIGSYSYVDGQGVRLAERALTYIVWHAFLAGIPPTLIVLVRGPRRIAAFLRAEGRTGAFAGIIATLGYAIVLWAMERSPLALVTSLRETSVIFAALAGTLALGEPFGRRRVIAAVVVSVGIALLNLPR